eukprot:m.313808 g.313808  ORF g.313808 m.313808 type:complete len:242 (-) comp27489_c0_seq14:251-976(-)
MRPRIGISLGSQDFSPSFPLLRTPAACVWWQWDVKSPHPILRLVEAQSKHWYHAYQWLYVPLALSMVTATYPFDNLLLSKAYLRPKRWLFFAIWVALAIVLPYLNHGWRGLGHVALMYVTVSIIMGYSFQVSHNHRTLRCGDRAGTPAPYDPKGPIDIDAWLRLQIEESVSWGGYWSTLVWGGLNMQIEHHICPGHDTTLYYFISLELKKICAKYGIRYTYEPSLVTAVRQYHRDLYHMGQ